MQTIGRTSVGTARKDNNRIDQAGGTIRCDKSRESYGANGCRNSFLKTPILPIAPQTIMRESYCGNSLTNGGRSWSMAFVSARRVSTAS